MTYKVFKSFRVRTLHSEDEIQPGELIKLSPQKAQGLLEKGKIKPYCYWLENVVDDCRICFEIDAMRVLYECPHFKTFWDKRISKLQNMSNDSDVKTEER